MAFKVKPKKKQVFCDPAVCDHCMYICEGDFICDKKAEAVIVVSDWEPTEDYLWCQRRRDGNGK
jgi:hypothetical protein